MVGVWLVASCAIFLPLAIDPLAAVSFALPKAAVLGVLAYALAGTLAALILVSGWRAIPLSWLHLPVALYLLALLVAAVFAVDRNLAAWGAYDRRLGLVSAVQLAVVYLGAATFVRTLRQTATVLAAAAGTAVVVLGYALLQRLALDPIRWSEQALPFATLGNSNVMGHYFASFSAAAISGVFAFLPWRGGGRIVVPVVLFAAFVLGTVLSGARAALLGLAAGVVVTAAIAAWRMAGGTRGRVATLGLAVGVVALAGALTLFTPAGARIAALASGSDLSFAERSILYGTVLEIVKDHPVLGVGPDNFPAVYNAYRPVEALRFAGPLTTQSSAHGWPWRVALETGAVGSLAFTGLIVAIAVVAIRELRRPGDWRPPILTALLAAHLAAGIFTISHLGTEWIFWLAAGLLAGAGVSAVPPAIWPLRGPRLVAALALALGLLWPIAAVVNDLSASRSLVQSRSATLRDTGRKVTLAREAADADGRWPIHWNNLGLRGIEAGQPAVALAAFERAAQIGPYDPLIWKNLGTAQAQLGATQPPMRERARASAQRAIAADPNNAEARAGAAQIYVLVGDGEAAAREAEAALALAPGNDTYLELAANGYLQERRLIEARTAVQSALAFAETWQRRYLLARVYVLEGKTAEARTELRRVLELDPANKAAEALLVQVGGR